MKIKNILLTFDYELFLGEKSGSVDKCLIEPTNRLIEIFEKYSCNAVFFVDTTYLIRLSEIIEQNKKAKADYEKIKSQIQELITKGHDVFPHIHPHWIDAVYVKETNQWELKNVQKYRFHNISEQHRNVLFEKSFSILEEIIHAVKQNYKINSYRAGGWCIQPFSDFNSYFEKHQITNEFSVLRNNSNFSDVHYFDFTKIPTKNCYRFDEDICVESKNGKYIQYSISTVEINNFPRFIEKFLLKYLWKTGNRSIGDGRGIVSQKVTNLKSDSLQNEMISIELLNAVKFPIYWSFINKNNYMQFISHPKILSKHNFKILEQFLKKVSSRYKIESDFRKIVIE